MTQIIKGFKGFDKDFKCRDMQFEVGKEFTAKGTPVACENGIHFCENPLDVFAYYDPANSRFAEVESRGEVAKHEEDSKVATDRLFIKAELSLKSIIDWGVKLIIERTKDKKEVNSGNRSAAVNSGDRSAAVNSGDRSAAVNSGNSSAAVNSGDRSAAVNSGDRSAAVNSGYSSAAVNSGYSSAAVNSGYRSAAVNSGNSSAAVNSGYSSAAEVSGVHSVAISLGIDGKAKGNRGSWLTISEWKKGERIDVKTAKVDGKKIKENVFYKLVGGKFIEA